MPRLMSVAYTADAVIARTKSVTRRKGWAHARPGMPLTLCRKVMGRRKGEPLERLAEVVITEVERQPLSRLLDSIVPGYGAAEVALEGFPGMAPEEFVRRFFVEAQGMRLGDYVHRIRWRYLAPTEDCPECRSGKHPNCTGWALDDADEMVECPCAEGGHL